MIDGVFSTDLESGFKKQLIVSSKTANVKSFDRFVSISVSDLRHPMRLHITGFCDSNLSTVGRCQVSIASRLDDQPLWNLIDADADGRIVQLEKRAAVKRILALDVNADNTVSPDEWPMTFHLVVCQGNSATEMLQTASAANASTTRPQKPAPDWFVGMDSNRDGVLSRTEFTGKKKHFAKYDHDGDGLLTPSELTISKLPIDEQR